MIEVVIAISVLSVLLLIVVLCICLTKRRNRLYGIVKEISVLYKQICALNNETTFFTDIMPQYNYSDYCNSKRQFDKYDLNNLFLNILESNLDDYKKLIIKADNNLKIYNDYCTKYNSISSNITTDEIATQKISYKNFVKIEKKLYAKNKYASPPTQTSVYCKVTYTSPKGRNHYMDDRHYSYTQIKQGIEHVERLIERKNTRQYQIKLERSKMSDALRYDIMKRDNYRCRICGSTSSDGIKLHVDHIKPVSKGGKTLAENLQTLCDRCNMGKSNKI